MLLSIRTFLARQLPRNRRPQRRHLATSAVARHPPKTPPQPSTVDRTSATPQPPPPPPSDRRCYVWGLSETGALGMHKSLKKQSQRQAAFIQHPTRLQFAERHEVLDIAAGYGFTAFAVRQRDGISLYGSGINTDGQLGYQHLDRHADRPLELVVYPAPIALPDSDAQITRCAAGRAHLLALDARAGRVYALGNNAYGQCGRPVVADEAYMESGTVHVIDGRQLDDDDDDADGDDDNARIVDVHAGQDHSVLLTAAGRVFTCGWGADGQTGHGHYAAVARPQRVRGAIATERVRKVAGGVDCVLALSADGEVFGWGNSEYGQLQCDGDEQQINQPRPLREMLAGCGRIVDVAAGGSSCIALNENGDCFVWGYGLLGLGPQVDHQARPTRIPAALFGRNEFAPNARVRAVFAGISHMAAITDADDVYVWGRNRFGCLGLGHTKDQFFPMKAAVAAKVEKVSCGVDHTVAMCRAFV